MHDDFHSQAWADNHQHLSAAIHKVTRKAWASFEQLHAYRFDAPWRPRADTHGTGARRRPAI